MAQFADTTRIPHYLYVEQQKIEKIAQRYGLDFFPVIFEMISYSQMNEIAAYGGFPNRYPHWRFGMDYERLAKSAEYGLSKIYELVINNNPAIAYLLEGNSLTDQKLVMCHVLGHVDFFKNNFLFRATDLDAAGRVVDPMKRPAGEYSPNRKWVDKMANHGGIVRRIVDRYGIEKVEELIDECLSLENLIDPWSPFVVRTTEEKDEEEPSEVEVPRLRAKEYMESFINPEEYLEAEKKKLVEKREKQKGKLPRQPTQDVLAFLMEHAPLERWERAIVEVIREEAYYFLPQAQTKVLNEGWACVDPETLVFAEPGLVPMREVVEAKGPSVSDGETMRRVYDRHIIEEHETVTVRTRRGLTLTGSTNHRVLLSDGVAWRRMDELCHGDRVLIRGGGDHWPSEPVEVRWRPPQRRSLTDVAEDAGVSLWTVLRYRRGLRVRARTAVAAAMEAYEAAENSALPQAVNKRRPLRVPSHVTPELGAFLGYLVGDGHISKKKRHVGLTTGDDEQAASFARLANDLFGLPCRIRQDGGRLRVLLHSEHLSDFLIDGLGLLSGPSAPRKTVPAAVLRSPESVVAAFLRAYFDCDGYAGKMGVILSSSSPRMCHEVQLLLLNFGILSRRRRMQDGCEHVHIMGASAVRFAERIGFGLTRKQRALTEYIETHQWFKREAFDDEVVSIEQGRGAVYDISVKGTHRYAAAGFVNHNSFWHSRMMTEQVCDASEILDYADNNAAVLATSGGQLNPYKLGVELFRDIEERWDRGQFGREWEDCDDLEVKRNWDLRLGLGRQKVFEVRALYSDVTFIDEFLTTEFARRHKLFTFEWSNRSDRFEIESREFRKVKEKLLFQLTNRGNPYIYVENANFENRGELMLHHDHRGIDLRLDYARETLKAMQRLWKRPVCVLTVMDGKNALLRFDGKEHSVRHDVG